MEHDTIPDEMCRPCVLEELPDVAGTPWEYKPCQKVYKLDTEDVISVDSIVSEIMTRVHPSIDDYKLCDWGLNAKEMLNEKNYLMFEERLYMSQLTNTNCKLAESVKCFLEHELRPVGEYTVTVEESYDGYVVFAKSRMRKGKAKNRCGHTLTGKYDDKFRLIVEKRTEYEDVDGARIQKTLEVRRKADRLSANRTTSLNDETQEFQTLINLQGRREILLMDGGVQLFMRNLVMNHFRGEVEYYTMNLFGKMMRCKLVVHKERHKIRVFHMNFDQLILVTNSQYFDNELQESSETYMTVRGRTLLHYWHNYNYVLHSTAYPVKPPEIIIPRLELMWRTDHIMRHHYEERKKLTYDTAMAYLKHRPEVVDFMHDYVLSVIKYKPNNVIEFTIKFFQNMFPH